MRRRYKLAIAILAALTYSAWIAKEAVAKHQDWAAANMLLNTYFFTPAAPPSTSYSNPGGTGNRASFWTITTNITPSSGAVANIINGNLTADATNSFKMGAAGDKLKYIKFTATDGNAYCIDELRFEADLTNDMDDWMVGATNNDEDYVELGTLVNFHGGLHTLWPWTNTNYFKSYIFWQIPGGLLSTNPFIEEFEFKISTSGSPYSVPTNVPSYLNKYGFLDRTGFMTITTTATTGGGTINNLLDGAAGTNSTDAWFPNSGQSAREIVFDVGSGNTWRATEAQWFSDSLTDHGTWQASWSDDGSSYTNFGSTFTVGGGTAVNIQNVVRTIDLSAMPTGHRFMKWTQTSGTTSSGPWNYEVLIKSAKV